MTFPAFTKHIPSKPENQREQSRLNKRIAMGRWAVGEDIANAVCFLASPLNTYITVQALPVEGGYLPAWADPLES